MNTTGDVHDTRSPEDDGPFGAREAATLLEQTRRRARNTFNPHTALLSLSQALAMLLIYGAIWHSSRGHHPYRGPSLTAVGWVYLVVAVVNLVIVAFYVRARAGVSGPSQREDKIAAIPAVAAIVGVYVFNGALYADGFSLRLVYGVFDAAGPWLVVGAALAGLAAAKEDWWKLGSAVAVMAVAVGAAFAGPVNVWGVLALSGFVIFLGQAALRFQWSRRA
ncbi:MAG: hypothetical protein ACRDPI_05920 [Nocardioidaceae bacterium]